MKLKLFAAIFVVIGLNAVETSAAKPSEAKRMTSANCPSCGFGTHCVCTATYCTCSGIA